MNLRKRVATSLGATLLLASSLIGVASAEETVTKTGTVEITGGSLTGQITFYDFNDATFSLTDQTVAGTLTSEISDLTGSGNGWTAVIVADDLKGVDFENNPIIVPVVGTNFPAVSEAPNSQPFNTSWCSIVGTALNSAKCSVPEDEGSGIYTATIPVAATIPANTPVQSLESEATLTFASGPNSVA